MHEDLSEHDESYDTLDTAGSVPAAGTGHTQVKTVAPAGKAMDLSDDTFDKYSKALAAIEKHEKSGVETQLPAEEVKLKVCM